jgi:two-component system OmpR family response regulator
MAALLKMVNTSQGAAPGAFVRQTCPFFSQVRMPRWHAPCYLSDSSLLHRCSGTLAMRVLVVEDDPATRDLLARGLREAGMDVSLMADAIGLEVRVAEETFDAIVLDVVLPGDDGFTVCRRLRARGIDTPVLLLTGRNALADRVRGLDAGADDYLPKPFSFEELLARLRALTRRGRTRQLTAVLTYGGIELDQRDRIVRVNGQTVDLTATEFRLLEYLLRRAGALVTRDELAAHVWNDAIDRGSNVIDVYVGYLRKRLGPEAAALLRTVRGMGYTLGAASDRRRGAT